MGHRYPAPARQCGTMRTSLQRMAIDNLWVIVFVIICIFSAFVAFG